MTSERTTKRRNPMGRPRPFTLLTLLTAGALLTFAPARADVDAFYLQRLEDGRAALDRRDWERAAEELRTAAFGMLDNPSLLSSTLIRLGLAQAGANDATGFRATFARVAEIEQRHQVYAQLLLEPAERQAFEAEARRRIDASTLRALPAFQALAAPTEKVPGKTSSKKAKVKAERPAAAPTRPAATRPKAETKPAKTAPGTVVVDTDAPPPPDPNPNSTAPQTPAPPTAAPTAAELARLRQARERMAAATTLAQMNQALDLAREVADAHTTYAAAQLLAGEIAYRGSRWQDAARYLERANIDGTKQPEYCFYLAVALFESGDSARAASVLRPCVPSLARTDLVTAYLARVLPQPKP